MFKYRLTVSVILILTSSISFIRRVPIFGVYLIYQSQTYCDDVVIHFKIVLSQEVSLDIFLVTTMEKS